MALTSRRQPERVLGELRRDFPGAAIGREADAAVEHGSNVGVGLLP
jgi:hypothetical protein